MKNIAVLLTCFNRKDKTLESITSLKKALLGASNVNIEVFLVDDGCTDGTAEVIKSLHPDVNIIQADGTLFWNRGMNLAWTKATEIKKFDFYLWLNDDTFLLENSLQILFDASKECNHRAIIIGSTKSSITQEITYGGRNKLDQLLFPNGVLQQCNHFNGNIVLIPAYVYNILGKLDSVFHHAIGDFDYGLRANKAQIRMYVAPDYVGYCEGHDNFAKWCRPEVALRERIKLLYNTTCDCNPKQFFIFERRHYGLTQAIIHYITIHIRVVAPKLWLLKKQTF